MKSITKLKDILFIQLAILMLFAFQSYAQNSVSGTVRYSDNNEIVTQGFVKAYKTDGSLIEVTYINSNGSYSFGSLEPQETDLIGVANLEPEEEDSFIPTYYPDALLAPNAVTVYPDHQLTGIDIYVERIVHNGNGVNIASISGKITLNNKPVRDAIIHAMFGGEIISFDISDNNGIYQIKNIPAGDYILVIHRIGTDVVNKNVTITNEGITNFNVNLDKQVSDLVNNNKINFKLSQNYPNPFNPSTVITYTVNKPGNVNISVFNSAGQMVKELVNCYMTGGSYKAEFEGNTLASGIYYYKMVTAGYSETRKMILLK